MATNERFQTFVYWIAVLFVWLVCAFIGAVVSTSVLYVAAFKISKEGLRFSLGAVAVAVILLGIVASLFVPRWTKVRSFVASFGVGVLGGAIFWLHALLTMRM